jgi:hypothetical protein
MEDIIKMFYQELGDIFIEPHIHRYTSPLNRVLVDYKLLMHETMVVIGKKKSESKAEAFSPRISSRNSNRLMTRGISEIMSAV